MRAMSTLRFAQSTRSRPFWRRGLLAFGLLVVLMQGMAMAQGVRHVDATGLPSDVCTVRGIVGALDSNPLPADTDAGDRSGTISHECCLACVIGAAPTPVTTLGAVSPAPTSRDAFAASADRRENAQHWVLAPARAPPRG